MTVIVCFLLLLVATVMLRLGRARWAAGFLLASLVVFYVVGTGLAPSVLLGHAQPRALASAVRWEAHNTIVVLGAGTMAADGPDGPQVPFFAYSRIAATARAYFGCRRRSADCKVIISGGDPQKHGRPEARVYSDVLAELQVPRGDVALEDRSNNTWQNAQFSTFLVAAGRNLVVVTSGFQLDRAMLYFSHFRPEVHGVASDQLEVEVGLLPTSMNLLVMDLLLHEQIGVARYHVYNLLGWNAPSTSRRAIGSAPPASKS